MAAANSDLFRKGGANTVTTLAAPGKALAATSITVGSTTNYPTDTGIVIGIRQVDSDGVLVPGTYSEYNATVTSGTTFSIDAVPVLGSDQVYPAGSTTQVFLPVSSSAHNDLIDGLVVSHDQDGTLKTDSVDSTQIKADAITTPKLADGSVTADKVDFTTWNAGDYTSIVSQELFTSNTTTGTPGASVVGWNGNGDISYPAISGKKYKLTMHEPSLTGYSGSGNIAFDFFHGTSSSWASRGTRFTSVDIITSGYATGVNLSVYFTSPSTGTLYILIGLRSYGISGTITITRTSETVAQYTIERV